MLDGGKMLLEDQDDDIYRILCLSFGPLKYRFVIKSYQRQQRGEFGLKQERKRQLTLLHSHIKFTPPLEKRPLVRQKLIKVLNVFNILSG